LLPSDTGCCDERATLAGGEHPRSVLFVSPRALGPAPGVAANYAVALAQAGRRVALLEADLRAPALHQIFGTSSQIGLAEALSEGLALDATSMPHAPAVALITAGRIPPDPSALLDSPRFAALLAELRERFDCVVIDCAPALEFADAAIVARTATRRCRARPETSRADAAEASRTLRIAGARILGGHGRQKQRSIWRSPCVR
jgi:capsular exopolysaccharide synthesis family protein